MLIEKQSERYVKHDALSLEDAIKPAFYHWDCFLVVLVYKG